MSTILSSAAAAVRDYNFMKISVCFVRFLEVTEMTEVCTFNCGTERNYHFTYNKITGFIPYPSNKYKFFICIKMWNCKHTEYIV